ncbi:hypothetical protein A2U01_0024715, partial [Trifolium medium]|nr:hypothetical protein [Trifolium medium]
VFGEIEPNFYHEFKAEFGKVWRLFDSDGLQHRVNVDDEDEVPLITNGWMGLREHYQFEGHHEIFFKYLGRNYFQIIRNTIRITPATFPTWHSLCRPLRKAVNYKMTMTEDPEVNPHLGWLECVRVHGFKVGDELAFNMCSIYENYMIWVRKLG